MNETPDWDALLGWLIAAGIKYKLDNGIELTPAQAAILAEAGRKKEHPAQSKT